ncbi:MAG: caspase family protein, partial [Ignavibacteria bacterium]
MNLLKISTLIVLINLSAFTAAIYCQIDRGVIPISKLDNKLGKSYAIIIGISDYKNVSDLQFADRDALAFKSYLLNAAYPKIDSQNVELFINEQATRINVSDAISNILKKTKSGDIIYFYFAGHGDIEDLTQSKNGLLLLYESPIDNYFGMSDGVIQVSQLAEYFGKLTNLNIDVNYIIDACHSGKLNGGEQGRVHTSKAIRYSLTEGSTLMLSCDADQLSIEGREWGGGRGLFSYYLENGLAGLADIDNDNLISLFEIDQYVRKQTYRESEKKQIPIISGDFTKIIAKVSHTIKDSIEILNNKQLKILTEVNYKVNESNYVNALDSLSQENYKSLINIIIEKIINESKITQSCMLFRSVYNRNPESTLSTILKRKLIVFLNANFDSLVKPILIGKSPTYTFQTLQNLEIGLDSSLNIIEKSHYLYNHILSRKYLISALLKSYNISINNYTNQNLEAITQAISLLHMSRS